MRLPTSASPLRPGEPLLEVHVYVRSEGFMQKINTTHVSGLAVAAVALVVFSLAGCSAAPAAPEPIVGGSTPTTSASTPVSTPRPGEAAISTDHVCGQVSTLATLEDNTVAGFSAGVVPVDEYVAQMNVVAVGYEHVLVNDSAVGDRVADAVAFLKTAGPSADGVRFDHDSAGWQSAVSAVAFECNSAGSSIAVLADFGG